jgi:hypothetical protein
MDKKGELTSSEIITLVIVVLSALVLLFFLWLWFYGFTEQTDICKLSVLTRATTPDVLQRTLPLKCKSTKICLTDDGSSKCDEQFLGEEGVDVITLKGTSPQKRTQIEEVSANAMYDCWNMMGQGKLDLFGEAATPFGLIQVKSSCVICSRVAIDKSVVYADYKNKIPTNYKNILYASDGGVVTLDADKNPIPLVDINTYMRTHQVPGSSLTYLQTFTDKGVSSFSKVETSQESEIAAAEARANLDGKTVQAEGRSTKYPQMAFVFMQVKSVEMKQVATNLIEAGATMAGLTFMTPIIGKGATWAAKTAIVCTKGLILIPVAAAAGAVVGYGMWNAHQGQVAAAGYCGAFTSSDASSKGCSLVQGVDYNVKTINALCGREIAGEP